MQKGSIFLIKGIYGNNKYLLVYLNPAYSYQINIQKKIHKRSIFIKKSIYGNNKYLFVYPRPTYSY